MTGPEHYAHAEELLDLAADDDDLGSELERYRISKAQVHATLAHAAATAGLLAADEGGWQEVSR